MSMDHSILYCDCGCSVTIEDGYCLQDIGVEKCENGHYICNDCLPQSLDHYHNPEKYVELEDYDTDGYLRLIKKSYCPFCSLENISNYDLKAFIFKKYSINKADILKEIRTVFKNYENFVKYIYNKDLYLFHDKEKNK